MERKHTPIHLRPHAAVAERVLLPGDPGRALRLAQALIDGPKMLNHHRGLWGYTGPARSDGGPLTVQATGLGGPSAAAVVADLAALGARRAVRVGTCTALDRRVAAGTAIVATEVAAADGTGRALAGTQRLLPDDDMVTRAREALPAAAGLVVSVDVMTAAGAPPDEALARDLGSAGVLAAAARHGIRAAVVLVVTSVAGDGERLADDRLHPAELRAGKAALAALGPV